MRVLTRVLGGIALLLLVFLVIGETLPGRWHAEARGEVDISPDSVSTLLSRVRSWQEWMAWPKTGARFAGPSYGPGAAFRWNDPTYGSGTFIITETEPGRGVRYRVRVEGGSILVKGRISLQPSAKGTSLRWTEDGSVGWNPLLGYVALGMSDRQTSQLQSTLARFESFVEGGGEHEQRRRARPPGPKPSGKGGSRAVPTGRGPSE